MDNWGEDCDKELFLDLLYTDPPPTVYHQDWGVGMYHSTQAYDESSKRRKQFSYIFEDGQLRDV